jgi:hypothetical protein
MKVDAISAAWNGGKLSVRVRHPVFGYVCGYERGSATGAQYTCDFTNNRAKAILFTSEKLRTPLDANGNGLMRLFTHSYSGMRLDIVTRDE